MDTRSAKPSASDNTMSEAAKTQRQAMAYRNQGRLLFFPFVFKLALPLSDWHMPADTALG